MICDSGSIIYFYISISSLPPLQTYSPVPLVITFGRANSYKFCPCKSSKELCQPLNEVRTTSCHLQSGVSATVALAQLMRNRKEERLRSQLPDPTLDTSAEHRNPPAHSLSPRTDVITEQIFTDHQVGTTGPGVPTERKK